MLGIALVHAVLMTIFVFDLVSKQRVFLHEQSDNNILSLSQTLASNSVSWVLANDVIGLEELVDSQTQFPDLVYVMILSPSGRVLGHSDHSKVGLYVEDATSCSLIDAEPVPQYLISNSSLVDISSPILANGKLIGWARVGSSQEKINAGLKDIIREGIWYTVFAIVVGSIFAWLMARGITLGVQHLVSVAEQIRKGDESARIHTEREDELGQLGTTLNNLFDTQIRQKIMIQRTQLEQHQTLLEYKKTVVQLEETSNRLELVIEGARLGTWDWNIKTGDVVFNDRWAEIIGYTLEELAPNVSTWKQVIHPEESDKIGQVLIEHLEEHSAVYLTEYRLKHKSGEWIWVLDAGKVISRDENGAPLRAVGIHLDITKQKEVEVELKKALAEVKTLSGFLPICSFCKSIRDDDGYWHQLEQYISEHSDTVFSHGLCMKCAKEHYGDLMNPKVKNDVEER